MSDLKSKLNPIRRDMDKALAEIAKRHGLQELKAAKCTYDPRAGNFVIKVEGVDGEGIDKDAARYKEHVQLFGDLPALGTEFQAADDTKYRIVGLNTTGSKVICARVTGVDFAFREADQKFLFVPDAVRRLCKFKTKGERADLSKVFVQ